MLSRLSKQKADGCPLDLFDSYYYLVAVYHIEVLARVVLYELGGLAIVYHRAVFVDQRIEIRGLLGEVGFALVRRRQLDEVYDKRDDKQYQEHRKRRDDDLYNCFVGCEIAHAHIVARAPRFCQAF